MIKKEWSNRKKVSWLNIHFKTSTDFATDIGRYWYVASHTPPYEDRVAYLPEAESGLDGLEVAYDKIRHYKNSEDYKRLN